MTDKFSLVATAREHLKRAQAAGSGRSADSVIGGHTKLLRQTVVALVAGRALDEHESPGEATLQVLTGRVRLDAGPDSWEGTTGDLLVIPPMRHSLHALEDAVVLLTVARPA
jgi:quercetin dioxygenase-like cupin family protein